MIPLFIIAPPEPLIARWFVMTQLSTCSVLELLIAAPLPVVLPFTSTSRDRLFVVPAAKMKSGRLPPPLMTEGTSVRPIIATLFVIVGNCNPSVIALVTLN